MKISNKELKEMLDAGKSLTEISKEFSVSMGSLKYWCKKWSLSSQYGPFGRAGEKTEKSYQKGGFKNFKKPVDETHLNYKNWTEDQQKYYSYILGFYLGDGHLGYNKKKGGRSYTFVITNHLDFSSMNKRIQQSLQLLFPSKNIRTYKRKRSPNTVDISFSAVNLNLLFPYGNREKHTRKIKLTDWQNTIIEKYPKELFKGLMESDGCRFAPRKKVCPSYIIYTFSNCSLDIHEILHKAAKKLNLNFTFRKVVENNRPDHHANKFWTCFNDRESFKILEEFIGPKK